MQTPSMLLRRPTQLRSIWSWLLSELRRPSCNALVLQPRTGQCATTTHGPDSLLPAADVRIAELAFALAFMCIALAPRAIGFSGFDAASSGGNASPRRGVTSRGVIPVKQLLFAVLDCVVELWLVFAALMLAFTLLRAQAVVIMITPDMLVASLCTTLASWPSARDMGVRLIAYQIAAYGPHQRSLDLIMVITCTFVILEAPNWLADVIGWAFKRFTSMCIHIAATPVMVCFDLAYEHFDMAARRAAIAPSAAAAERAEGSAATDLATQRAAADATSARLARRFADSAAAQQVATEAAIATIVRSAEHAAAAQRAAADAASARLARQCADSAAAQQVAMEAAIATIVRFAEHAVTAAMGRAAKQCVDTTKACVRAQRAEAVAAAHACTDAVRRAAYDCAVDQRNAVTTAATAGANAVREASYLVLAAVPSVDLASEHILSVVLQAKASFAHAMATWHDALETEHRLGQAAVDIEAQHAELRATIAAQRAETRGSTATPHSAAVEHAGAAIGAQATVAACARARVPLDPLSPAFADAASESTSICDRTAAPPRVRAGGARASARRSCGGTLT